jgi:hypothetical protein
MEKYLALLFIATLAGCGGRSSPTSPQASVSQLSVSVVVSPANAQLQAGMSQQFTASVQNSSNAAVNWSVDNVAGGNSSLGSISSAGMYTAPAGAGNHTVTATSAADSSRSATAQVTVTAPVALSISPANVTIPGGSQQQFLASVGNTSNHAVSWSVDGIPGGSAQAGTIATNGFYAAPIQSGLHTITAISAADTSKNGTAQVTVNSIVAVSIAPSTVLVSTGNSQQFVASVSGTTNIAVSWSVDGFSGGNGNLGTITNNGLYHAPATSGAHVVVATSAADPSRSGSANVTIPVGVSISPPQARIAPSGSVQFNAVSTDGSLVLWSVDGVAGGSSATGTISTTGQYSAPPTPGTHTITAARSLTPSVTAQALVTVPALNYSSTPVLTYHNDVSRDGANLNESILSPANVNQAQFGRLFSYPVDGQTYAQPLFVPNLTINGQQHNVVYVVTEHDSVYAFDADGLNQNPLWHDSFIDSNAGITTVHSTDVEGISPELGITGTPVIDPNTNTLYVVDNRKLSNGARFFYLHALDLMTGAEKFNGPVKISASVPGTASDAVNGTLTFSPFQYQRAGLALATNVVYIAFGHGKHGWVLGYTADTLQQVAAFCTTPDGAGGSIWMGGDAPAVDSAGNLFLITAVDFGDPPAGYPDSLLKLGTATPAGTFGVEDFFTPSNQAYLALNDADLGSGGEMILPDNTSAHPHELIGGGKDGRIFVVDRDNMGGINTAFDNVVQTVHTGKTQFDVLFDTPAFWNGNVYYHPEQDVLQAFQYNNGLLSTWPIMLGAFVYGNHGATVSISANGNSAGIAWELQVDQWRTNGPAILRAYDATNAQELYNSSQAGSRDVAGPAIKFTVPTIANGYVYVGTATELDVYGVF